MLNLEQLGKRLKMADHMLVSLLAIRRSLALQVEEYKREKDLPIYRSEIEKQRLDQATEWAKEFGLNPEFVRGLLYAVINESCKDQLIQMQGSHNMDDGGKNDRLNQLRINLLELTKEVASDYGDGYLDNPVASAYSVFEWNALEAEICKLNDHALAIDLGCADGTMSFKLASHFEKVIGYDISPQMVEVAEGKRTAANVSFNCHDVETGLPLQDESVSLVVMNMGTASDIPEISAIISELKRLLKPGGKAFLSFYNKNALINRWDFIPWQVGLSAQFNPVLSCLEVRRSPTKLYRIFAELYSRDDIMEIMPSGLKLDTIQSYPTFESILPSELLEEDSGIRHLIEDADAALSGLDLGAYLMVVIEKG